MHSFTYLTSLLGWWSHVGNADSLTTFYFIYVCESACNINGQDSDRMKKNTQIIRSGTISHSILDDTSRQ